MSHKLNSAIAEIGIDIGKNSFHAVGQDKRGEIVLRQKWSRGPRIAGWIVMDFGRLLPPSERGRPSPG